MIPDLKKKLFLILFCEKKTAKMVELKEKKVSNATNYTIEIKWCYSLLLIYDIIEKVPSFYYRIESNHIRF